MTLKQWFKIKFRNKIFVASALLLLMQMGFISAFTLHQIRQFKKDVAYVADTVSIGISQKNHELIISTLASASDRWGVSRLELCVGDKQIFALPLYNSDCEQSTFQEGWFRDEIKIVGFESAKLRVVRSPLHSTQIILILISSAIFIYLIFASQFRAIASSIETDLFGPLGNKLVEDRPLEIAELEEIRVSLSKWKDNIAESARSEAYAQMATQVAHDIRAPLSAINAALAHSDAASFDKTAIVRKAALRINDIANQLLASKPIRRAFSPLGENAVNEPILALDDIDIRELVREIFEEKKLEIGKFKNIEFVLDMPNSSDCRCMVNRPELLRVISNLTNNAVESLNESGSVRLAVRSDCSSVSISILDTGIGIPEDILSRLGTEHISVGKEALGFSGSGIGVFCAKSAVSKMRGRLVIQSKTGTGTLVSITFPRG